MPTGLYQMFHETARNQPAHPAMLGPGDEAVITYRTLDQNIRELSERLVQAGLKAGDCVGLHHRSGAEYIVLTYAVWQCGGCVVPIATELAPQEKHQVCREIALDCLISEEGKAAFAEPLRRGGATPISNRSVLIPIESPRARPAGFDRLDAAFVRFTSGTTAASKGVVLSHMTIHERIHAANEALAIGPDDRVLWVLPMAYHFTVSIVSYLTFGAAIVFPTNHFAPAMVAACRERRATIIYGSPAQWALLADYADAAPLPELRLAISTTSALDLPSARKFHDRYGLPLTQALGIIEVGLPCINLDFAAEKWDSVGRVLSAYELRLEDVGLGGGLREVSFRGRGMLDAYYHPWQTRDEIMPDGWFRTGDVGELDEDGCLFLRGRRKDVINVMGMKFFPHEVEAVLASHPAVAEAAVFAHPSRRHGESPYALVVPKVGADQHGLAGELQLWCTRRLASYKVPESIELVGFLQRTASGKVLHRQPAEGIS